MLLVEVDDVGADTIQKVLWVWYDHQDSLVPKRTLSS